MSPGQVDSLEAEMDRAGVREFYDSMVASGQSQSMAAMLALRSPPGTWNTDSDFCRRERSRMAGMDDDELSSVIKAAKRAGVKTHGKTYNGSLGTYADQAAWVSGTHDVKQVAIDKGMDIDGMVKVNGYRGPAKKKRIATDILDGLEVKARSSDPELNKKCETSDSARIELRTKLTEKHTKPRD